MRALIIKTSALGDIIHALPVLDYLHQVVPDAQVDWAVEEQFADLLSGNQLLAELRVLRTRRWRRQPFTVETAREIQTLWHELREQKYEYVFDIQGNLKSGIIAWATGAEQRIGFSKDHLQESVNSFFIKRQIPQRKEDDHASGRYLRVISGKVTGTKTSNGTVYLELADGRTVELANVTEVVETATTSS